MAVEDSVKEPTNIAELIDFYYDQVKPLYGEIQVKDQLPQETLFELNAAFDHLTRFWKYGTPEDRVVQKAYGHFKRSCYDIYKLNVDNAHEQFDSLMSQNIGLIDNGEFKSNLIQIFHQLIMVARDARRMEGQVNSDEDAAPAFRLWAQANALCTRIEKDFYLNKNVSWAECESKRMEKKVLWRERVLAFVIGTITGFLGNILFEWFVNYFRNHQ